MALSGRQTAGAALAGAPEAGAAARIARCFRSHETPHRSCGAAPPRDRSGITIHHLHITDSYPLLHATNGPRLGGVRATSSRARSITSLRWHDASLFPPLAVQTGCQTSPPNKTTGCDNTPRGRTSGRTLLLIQKSSARPRTGSEGPMKAPTHHLPGAGMLVGFERHHRRAPYKRFLVGFKSHTKQ